MNFCSILQEKFAAHYPKWNWKVVENQNPSTSVIILSRGLAIPGELIVTVSDGAGKQLGQKIVGGQTYCDYVKSGQDESAFARDVGSDLLGSLNLS